MKCSLKNKEGEVIAYYPNVNQSVREKEHPERVYVYVWDTGLVELPAAKPEKLKLLTVIHLLPGQTFRPDN